MARTGKPPQADPSHDEGELILRGGPLHEVFEGRLFPKTALQKAGLHREFAAQRKTDAGGDGQFGLYANTPLPLPQPATHRHTFQSGTE